MSDEIKLLRASMAGDHEAFGAIVHKYQSLVCAITFSGTGRVDISEDLAQETFVRAWVNLKQLKDINGFKGWLCSISRNVVKNYYRSKKHVSLESTDAGEVVDSRQTPSEELISREEEAMLEKVLMRLPQQYREPLVMYYRQGKSTSEVAKCLDMKESTLRTRLSRARQMLRDEMAVMVERRLELTAPGKAFTVGVMAAVGSLALKGGAAVAATGVKAFLSTVTGKIVGSAAVVVISIGAVAIFKTVAKNGGLDGPAAPTVGNYQQQTINEKTDGQLVVKDDQSDQRRVEQVVEYSGGKEVQELSGEGAKKAVTEETAFRLKEKTVSYKGVVLDGSGNPVTNVKVSSYRKHYGKPSRVLEGETYTDSNGEYLIGPICYVTKEDRFLRSIVFDHPDYAIGWANYFSMDPAEKPGEIESSITLKPPSFISGGIVDTSGNPIIDASVGIYMRSKQGLKSDAITTGPLYDLGVTTDFDGKFRIDHLPPDGSVNLSVTHRDYAKYSSTPKDPMTEKYFYRSGDQDIQIVMERGGYIRGRVVYEDGRLYKDQDFRIDVADSKGREAWCYIKEDGTFQTYGLPNGSYNLEPYAYVLARQGFYWKPLTDVYVSKEHGATEIEMVIQDAVEVSVTVVDMDSGEPVPDVLVAAMTSRMYEIYKDTRGFNGRSNANGKLTVKIGEGKYQFLVKGYKNGKSHLFAKEVLITDDPNRLNVELGVAPAERVRGTLYDVQGRPVKGEVWSERKSEKTDGLGDYELYLDNLHGMKSCYVYAWNNSGTFSKAFTWKKSDGISEYDVVLEKSASIQGKIVGIDGNPVADATLSLNIVEGNGGSRVCFAPLVKSVLNPDGSFVISNIPSGLPYKVCSFPPGKQGWHKVLDIKPGENVDIGDLTVKALSGYEEETEWKGVLSGTVINENDDLIIGAEVRAEIGMSMFHDNTDINGRFRINGLPEGKEVRFYCDLDGYGSEMIRAVVDGNDVEMQIFPQGWDHLGKPAPGLYVQKWLNIDEDVTLEDYRGYVTLIHIGISINSYSTDLLLTRKMLDKYRDRGFEVIGIHHLVPSVFAANITEQDILDYIDTKGINYPFGIDDKFSKVRDISPEGCMSNSAMYGLYKVVENPALYLLDKKGVLRACPERDDLEDWIKILLEE